MSNEVDFLFALLEKELFSNERFFRKIVIVPNKAIADYLCSRISKSKIATGFKIFEIHAAIDYLMRLFGYEDKKSHSFPSKQLLALHLQSILKKTIVDRNILDASIAPLLRYLQEDDGDKICDLSDALAEEFLFMGTYGGCALEEFLSKEHWQKILWEKVFGLWDYPYKLFNSGKITNPLDFAFDIHLFGFLSVPMIYEKFFQKIAPFCSITEYFLNPCQYFWGDQCSEKERFFYHRLYEKRKIASKEIDDFEELLQERNGLLANFGGLARKRLNYLIDTRSNISEFFLDPVTHSIEEQEDDKTTTLLQKIKRDLFYSRSPSQTPHVADASFKIHACPTRKREVEVLLSVIMDLANKENIQPSDILVLAPDISLYYPFIYQVFHDQNLFAIEVRGLELLSQSHLLQGIWKIFNMSESSWEQEDILSFFTLSPFLKKWKIAKEDISLIKEWCVAAHIRFGYDAEHRSKIIHQFDSEEREKRICEKGSWKYGLNRLLFGIASLQDDDIKEDVIFFPIQSLDFNEGVLLGKLAHFLDELYADQKTLSTATLTLMQWVSYLTLLVDRYFEVEGDESAHYEFFMQHLKALQQLSQKVPEETYSFTSIRKYFDKAFHKKEGQFSMKNKEAIVFASLKFQGEYPAKVIYLLGMEEGSFPRAQKLYPFRELELKKCDTHSTSIEEDRQQLLDCILFAKEHLIFSYLSVDEEDGKEKKVSFLVEEVLDYLESYHQTPKTALIINHKSIGFHYAYFSEDRPFDNFSLRDYLLATSYYNSNIESKKLFPAFYEKSSLSKEPPLEDIFITIRELGAFAKNPLQYYLNRNLGLFLSYEESKEDRLAKEFTVPALSKASFRKEAFIDSFESALKNWDLKGALPSFIYHDIAEDVLYEEYLEMEKYYREASSIELSHACHSPYEKKKGHFVVPALCISLDGVTCHIEGKIEAASEEGYLYHGRNKIEDYIKAWPLYLVYYNIIQRDQLSGFSEELVLTKDEVKKRYEGESALEDLRQYIIYYLTAKKSPSPFLPSWAEAFLLKSKEELKATIDKSFKTPSQFSDSYHEWIFAHAPSFNTDVLHEMWDPLFQSTFASLKLWKDKGKKNG